VRKTTQPNRKKPRRSGGLPGPFAGPYVKPRIVAAMLLISLVVILALTDRRPDNVTLGLILGGALLLLDVKTGRRILGGS
jgi:hypothetical protein